MCCHLVAKSICIYLVKGLYRKSTDRRLMPLGDKLSAGDRSLRKDKKKNNVEVSTPSTMIWKLCNYIHDIAGLILHIWRRVTEKKRLTHDFEILRLTPDFEFLHPPSHKFWTLPHYLILNFCLVIPDGQKARDMSPPCKKHRCAKMAPLYEQGLFSK